MNTLAEIQIPDPFLHLGDFPFSLSRGDVVAVLAVVGIVALGLFCLLNLPQRRVEPGPAEPANSDAVGTTQEPAE